MVIISFGVPKIITQNIPRIYTQPLAHTSLDLSICFPTLLLDYDWKVHDDLCGSAHFPILLNNIGPDVDEPVSRWKLNKANWAQFQTLSTTRLLEDTVRKADDPIESFASIIKIAEETVPKTASKSKKAKKLCLPKIANLLLYNVKEHYDNSIIVQHTII